MVVIGVAATMAAVGGEDDWEGWVDEEVPVFFCPVSRQQFASADACFAHCATQHGLDILGLRDKLGGWVWGISCPSSPQHLDVFVLVDVCQSRCPARIPCQHKCSIGIFLSLLPPIFLLSRWMRASHLPWIASLTRRPRTGTIWLHEAHQLCAVQGKG